MIAISYKYFEIQYVDCREQNFCILWSLAMFVTCVGYPLYCVIRSIKSAGKKAAVQADTTTACQNCGTATAAQQEIQMPIFGQYPSQSQSSQIDYII